MTELAPPQENLRICPGCGKPILETSPDARISITLGGRYHAQCWARVQATGVERRARELLQGGIREKTAE